MNVLKEQMSDQDSKEHSICICGDFNGERMEEFYNLIVKHESFKLADAYDRKLANPISTSRPKYVDYIFHSNTTLRLLNLVRDDKKHLRGLSFPNLSYPSDHLSLVCDFQFV